MKIESFKSWLTKPMGVNALFVFWALFITALWLPRNWGFYGNEDWDLTYTTFELARKSILEFGEWPHYNPYLAFGSDLDANPQAAHASIFFIPVLLFGSFYGYKVSILLAIFIGLHGMYRLLSSIEVKKPYAILLSMAFCSSTYFARHIIEAGHSNFLYFYLFPFLFHQLYLFSKDPKGRYLIIPILILSQFICGGAPLAFLMAAISMTLWSIGLILSKRLKPVFAIQMLICILLSFGLSFWKILPVLDFWNSNPRLVLDDSGINPLILLNAFIDGSTNTGTPHKWHEFSLGIGLLIPILLIWYRKLIPDFKIWMIISLFVIWIAIGNSPNYVNPWYILHHYFPVFDGMRAPSRFLFIILFGIYIGFAILINKLSHNELIYIIITGITLSNTLLFNGISRNMVFSKRIEDVNNSKFVRDQVIKDYKIENGMMYSLLKNGNFILQAYEPQHLPIVKDTLDVFSDGADVIQMSMNRIKLLMKDSVARISLRYVENWKTTNNSKISELNGLISIHSKTGNTIQLQYSNPIVVKGAWLCLLSIILSAILIFSLERKYKESVKIKSDSDSK